MRRPSLLCLALFAAGLLFAPGADAGKGEKPLHLTLQSRKPAANDKHSYTVVTEKAQWPAAHTAIIVCDVWDAHHCLNAVRRLEEMLPRMNEVLEKARAQGVLIIHAPSSCMDAYKDHPGRKLAQ